jgi:hypothetical protein
MSKNNYSSVETVGLLHSPGRWLLGRATGKRPLMNNYSSVETVGLLHSPGRWLLGRATGKRPLMNNLNSRGVSFAMPVGSAFFYEKVHCPLEEGEKKNYYTGRFIRYQCR